MGTVVFSVFLVAGGTDMDCHILGVAVWTAWKSQVACQVDGAQLCAACISYLPQAAASNVKRLGTKS